MKNKKIFKPLLEARIELNDYEKDFLVPGIKERLETLLGYAKWITDICDNHENDTIYGNLLKKIINPSNLEIKDLQSKDVAKKYFEDLRTTVQRDYIKVINDLLEEFSDISNMKTLAKFLTKSGMVAASIIQTKEKWITLGFRAFPYIIDVSTGEVIYGEPKDLTMILIPFQGALANINAVANSIHENIQCWHAESLKWKSEILNTHLQTINYRNNFILAIFQTLGIILAFALSAFFLIANDPFNLAKSNANLKRTITIFESEMMKMSDDLEAEKIKTMNLEREITRLLSILPSRSSQ